MEFQKLEFKKKTKEKMLRRSKRFLEMIKSRRTVRDFSEKNIPEGVIENAVKAAASAPSGANKEPWHFVIVKDPALKKKIRVAAEKEEKEFYEHRAPDSWLEDLNQFKTDWHKPFLEEAPALIVVFRQSYRDLGSTRKKNYYVNESVGIASGFLLVALHNAGLVTLTHTPSPMGFLEEILKRPKNEKAFLLIQSLYKILIEKDASLIEINPLILTKEEDLLCLDAKINFDDNALFRHPDILSLKDINEEDPIETEAKKHELSYIKLKGNIGCMVNGAGLAMATMDIIKLYGEEPANFLDVGGGASKEKVSAAFKIILLDKNVKGILINIFGGIMRCDVIAQGVVEAAKEIKLSIPLVVRMAGTNVNIGKEILKKSNLKIISANNLSEAAKKIVEVTR